MFTERQRNPTSVKSRITLCLCSFSSEYHVDDPPRLVLDKLEKIGFRVQTMTGVGQTLVWCLHKETEWHLREQMFHLSWNNELSLLNSLVNLSLLWFSAFVTLTAESSALCKMKIKFLNERLSQVSHHFKLKTEFKNRIEGQFYC